MGGMHLEEFGVARVVVFDTTGTLTEGRPEVRSVVSAEGVRVYTLMSLVTGVEHRSKHPIARAIMSHVEESGIEILDVSAFGALVGASSRASNDGVVYAVGSPSYGHRTSHAADVRCP